MPERSGASGNGKTADGRAARDENNLKNVDGRVPARDCSPASPASPAAASRRWSSRRCTSALARRAATARASARARTTRIEGLEHLDKVIDIDQSPIGRTPRSNPATYTGVFDADPRAVRRAARGARRAATSRAGSASTSRAGAARPARATASSRSRCTSCPTSTSPARPARASATTARRSRSCSRARSIADVLDMTVEEARRASSRRSRRSATSWRRWRDVGLGYIQLGQQATTLSGGEAQRVKLAKELSRRATGRTLYILDEPTTGLHFARRREAARGAARAGRRRQHRGRHRAQPRRHQDRRLDHRHRPRRRRRRRPHRRRGHARGRGEGDGELHRPVPARSCWAGVQMPGVVPEARRRRPSGRPRSSTGGGRGRSA